MKQLVQWLTVLLFFGIMFALLYTFFKEEPVPITPLIEGRTPWTVPAGLDPKG